MGPTAKQIAEGDRRAAILRAATVTRTEPIRREYWFRAGTKAAVRRQVTAFVRGVRDYRESWGVLIFEGGSRFWNARVVIEAVDHDAIRALWGDIRMGKSMISFEQRTAARA